MQEFPHFFDLVDKVLRDDSNTPRNYCLCLLAVTGPVE